MKIPNPNNKIKHQIHSGAVNESRFVNIIKRYTDVLYRNKRVRTCLTDSGTTEIDILFAYQDTIFIIEAKNIIACTRALLEKHNGEVPRSLEELTALAGVGRKTANVIRGNVYHDPSIVVDTHVKRISKRLGFTENDDPTKVEMDLMKVLPKDHWILYNIYYHWLLIRNQMNTSA